MYINICLHKYIYKYTYLYQALLYVPSNITKQIWISTIFFKKNVPKNDVLEAKKKGREARSTRSACACSAAAALDQRTNSGESTNRWFVRSVKMDQMMGTFAIGYCIIMYINV